MKIFNKSIPILLTALGFISLAGATVQAEEAKTDGPIGWDGAVNSLLAAGMYGLDQPEERGLSLKFQHSQNLYKGLAADKAQLNGQSITFSYEGSSGLLGFSAGYIYTSQSNGDDPGKVFLGIDPMDDSYFEPTRSWFMAFDLSQSYQLDDDITLGVGSKTMLMKNPFDSEEGQTFSMLFNMPISYKNYITITPELQWSRPLPSAKLSDAPISNGSHGEDAPQNTFYGGVSISFSY